MNLRQTIYNSIGLGLAGIAAAIVSINPFGVNTLLGGRLHLMVLAVGGAMVVFVGGSAALNMAAGRLKSNPTITMIIVYSVGIIFLPLAIWGLLELRSNNRDRSRDRKRDRQRDRNHDRKRGKHTRFAKPTRELETK